MERHYGDLDKLYEEDRLSEALQAEIPDVADKNRSSYRSAVRRYREYREYRETETVDPQAWSELLHRIEGFRADRNFEANELTYKLEVAAKVNTARQRLQSGTAGWEDLLRHAFTCKLNNLTDFRDHDKFLKWMNRESDQCRGALQALWSAAEPPEERLQSFCDQVPAEILGTLGARLNIGTFLLMAEDAHGLPPAKITPFRKVWKLAGRGNGPAGAGPGAVYGEILRFLDDLVRDGSNWPVPLHDRLEAQGAVWVLATQPDRGKKLIETYEANRWPEWTRETQIVERTHDPVFVRPVLHTKDRMRSHWVDIRIGALGYEGANYSDYAPASAADKAAQLRADAERAESSGGTVQFVIHLRKTSRRTTLTPAEARQVAHAIDEALQLLANLPTEKQPTAGGAERGGSGPPASLQPLADELLFDVADLERIAELLDDRRQVIFQGPPSRVS